MPDPTPPAPRLTAEQGKREWPDGVSDGLILPCGICGRHSRFDFTVDDGLWRRVVPEQHRLGVVCLPCFDALARAGGVDQPYPINLQFVGEGRTYLFQSTRAYDWDSGWHDFGPGIIGAESLTPRPTDGVNLSGWQPSGDEPARSTQLEAVKLAVTELQWARVDMKLPRLLREHINVLLEAIDHQAHELVALRAMKPAGIAREVSAFVEGEAALQWPANMSADNVLELEDWLALVIKKMKRRYGVTPDPKGSSKKLAALRQPSRPPTE